MSGAVCKLPEPAVVVLRRFGSRRLGSAFEDAVYRRAADGEHLLQISDGVLAGGVHPHQLGLLAARELGLFALEAAAGAGNGPAPRVRILARNFRSCPRCRVVRTQMAGGWRRQTSSVPSLALTGSSRQLADAVTCPVGSAACGAGSSGSCAFTGTRWRPPAGVRVVATSCNLLATVCVRAVDLCAVVCCRCRSGCAGFLSVPPQECHARCPCGPCLLSCSWSASGWGCRRAGVVSGGPDRQYCCGSREFTGAGVGSAEAGGGCEGGGCSVAARAAEVLEHHRTPGQGVAGVAVGNDEAVPDV